MPLTSFQKLVIRKMSLEAIPEGGGIAEGIEFLSNPGRIRDEAARAKDWAKDACRAVRMAKPLNPYSGASDEEISEIILRRMENCGIK